MTTSGTTSVAPAGESAAYEMEPKATGPEPGRSTASRTTAVRVIPCHHASSLAKRSAPRAVIDIVRPQPTSPSPRRTHAVTSTAGTSGMSESSAAPSSRVNDTVRATSGPVGTGPGSDAELAGAGTDVIERKA